MTERCCRCGKSLKGRSPRARYCSDACRTKAWKKRVQYKNPPRRAHRGRRTLQNGQTRRTPDLRISVRKLMPPLERELGVQRAHELVRDVLPPRLKERA